MSTFGGDSWTPETQYRKRRVEELLGEDIQEDEVRRMSNGRFACLVCPHCPVLDTLPMLHMHRKGARHQTAAGTQLYKKQRLHDEIQKRIALGKAVAPGALQVSDTSSPSIQDARRSAPLLTATKRSKAALSLGQGGGTAKAAVHNSSRVPPSMKREVGGPLLRAMGGKGLTVPASWYHRKGLETFSSNSPDQEEKTRSEKNPGGRLSAASVGVTPQSTQQDLQQEQQKRHQRELRLQESGWKRDGVGGWFRDENVEFDSDEEFPGEFT